MNRPLVFVALGITALGVTAYVADGGLGEFFTYSNPLLHKGGENERPSLSLGGSGNNASPHAPRQGKARSSNYMYRSGSTGKHASPTPSSYSPSSFSNALNFSNALKFSASTIAQEPPSLRSSPSLSSLDLLMEPRQFTPAQYFASQTGGGEASPLSLGGGWSPLETGDTDYELSDVLKRVVEDGAGDGLEVPFVTADTRNPQAQPYSHDQHGFSSAQSVASDVSVSNDSARTSTFAGDSDGERYSDSPTVVAHKGSDDEGTNAQHFAAEAVQSKSGTGRRLAYLETAPQTDPLHNVSEQNNGTGSDDEASNAPTVPTDVEEAVAKQTAKETPKDEYLEANNGPMDAAAKELLKAEDRARAEKEHHQSEEERRFPEDLPVSGSDGSSLTTPQTPPLGSNLSGQESGADSDTEGSKALTAPTSVATAAPQQEAKKTPETERLEADKAHASITAKELLKAETLTRAAVQAAYDATTNQLNQFLLLNKAEDRARAAIKAAYDAATNQWNQFLLLNKAETLARAAVQAAYNTAHQLIMAQAAHHQTRTPAAAEYPQPGEESARDVPTPTIAAAARSPSNDESPDETEDIAVRRDAVLAPLGLAEVSHPQPPLGVRGSARVTSIRQTREELEEYLKKAAESRARSAATLQALGVPPASGASMARPPISMNDDTAADATKTEEARYTDTKRGGELTVHQQKNSAASGLSVGDLPAPHKKDEVGAQHLPVPGADHGSFAPPANGGEVAQPSRLSEYLVNAEIPLHVFQKASFDELAAFCQECHRKAFPSATPITTEPRRSSNSDFEAIMAYAERAATEYKVLPSYSFTDAQTKPTPRVLASTTGREDSPYGP